MIRERQGEGPPDRSTTPRERGHVPSWRSPREGLRLVLRGYTLRTGATVSAVVGTLLSVVNQGSLIWSGHAGLASWLRVITNYVVPFFVSSIGYLAPFADAVPEPCMRSAATGGARSSREPKVQRPRQSRQQGVHQLFG
jgi:hypothetical protein